MSSFKDPIDLFLDKFLSKYRILPNATTGVSPAELMFKRKLGTRLDLLFPDDKILTRMERKKGLRVILDLVGT